MAGPIAPRLQGRELTASRGTNETRPDGGAVSPRTPRRRLTYLPDRQSKMKSGGPSTRLGDRPSRWFSGDAVSHSSRAASLPLAGHPAPPIWAFFSRSEIVESPLYRGTAGAVLYSQGKEGFPFRGKVSSSDLVEVSVVVFTCLKPAHPALVYKAEA